VKPELLYSAEPGDKLIWKVRHWPEEEVEFVSLTEHRKDFATVKSKNGAYHVARVEDLRGKNETQS